MFYSHEILTSRRYGVATVWLVATLGSKSSLKKVTRKAILDVDVPKACQTITDPAEPMALRLQGSLLYGLSRVFSEQCSYALADTQHFRNNIWKVAVQIKNHQIDLEVGNTRPDQLNIAEDPTFIPSLDLNFDISILEDTSDYSDIGSLFADGSLNSTQSSLQAEQEEGLGLIIPSNGTPGDFGDFDLDFALSAAESRSEAVRLSDFEESGIIENPDFIIAEDGSLHPIVAGEASTGKGAVALTDEGGHARLESDGGSSMAFRARDETRTNAPNLDTGDIPWLGGKDESLPPPFYPDPVETPQHQGSEQGNERSHTFQPTEQSESTADAPQQRVRPAKRLRADNTPELTNRQLESWNDGYLDNMEQARLGKAQKKSLTQAKRNATFWVLAQGIGGVEYNFGADRFPHPLAVFSGDQLWTSLTGREVWSGGRKRSLSEIIEEENVVDAGDRRVRARTEEEHHPDDAGELIDFQDDDMGAGGGGLDDLDIESEVGRHASGSLRDRSSVMPWNISLSRHGSSQRFGQSQRHVSSSAASLLGRIEYGPPSALGTRASRLVSASPLLRKSNQLAGLDIDQAMQSGSSINSGDDLPDSYMGALGIYDPDEAGMDVAKPTAQSHLSTKALDGEAENFLAFLVYKIEERTKHTDDDHEDGSEQGRLAISFTELLSPATSSKAVGAQGLLHVLALATKGFVEIRQKEAFDDIQIRLAQDNVARSDQDSGFEEDI